MNRPTTPTLRLLSLGAGVQSSALLLLAAEGKLPRVDGAIFADTGWEPESVYEHLNRIEAEVATPAGIPIYRVSVGSIRDDALNPEHRFASMPLYIVQPCALCDGEKMLRDFRPDLTAVGPADDQWLRRLAGWLAVDVEALPSVRPYTGQCPRCKGSGQQDGMARRQCTSEYKLRPVREQTRRLLGAVDKDNGRPGRVPTRRWAETWIGYSTDEADRAERAQDVGYAQSRFPLLELGMSRSDCLTYLKGHGFGRTPKSACIGCPYRSNKSWRHLRDTAPADYADAIAFDAAIRNGSARANAEGIPLRGEAYLHRSRIPLSVAPIERVTATEWAQRQGDLLGLTPLDVEESMEADEVTGCSPWSCGGDAA